MTHEIPRVRAAIDEVEPFGDTALTDGVHAAMVLESLEVGRSLLIVFSDGIDTSSWLSPEKVLETAKRSDIVVYAVSVRGTREGRYTTRYGGIRLKTRPSRSSQQTGLDVGKISRRVQAPVSRELLP